MQKHVVVDFPIKPEHINTEEHFFEAFGDIQTEASARWIIRFAQARGQGWAPFTYEEINEFCHKTVGNYMDFSFCRLTRDKWVKSVDGNYLVTIQFICACVSASPALSLLVKA